MGFIKQLFSRSQLGGILLLLILLRLVPFNFLHYHNGTFGGNKVVISNPVSQSDDPIWENNTGYCSFDQFLELIAHGFLVSPVYTVFVEDNYRNYYAILVKSDQLGYSIYLLNKGSPILA